MAHTTLKNIISGTDKTNNKVKIQHKDIKIENLDSMLDYQRKINMDRVEYISSDEVFDEKEVNEVKISVRQDGTMKVCDGQHTIAILKMRGYTSVPCELRYGMSIEDENDWFNVTNTKTKGQSRKRTLTSQINGTYAKNKDAQDFNNCIKNIGFKLNIYSEEAGSDFKINCPSNLLEVFKEYASKDNTDEFIECMDLVKSCWNGNSKSLQWSFLRGMFDFYESYKNEFDRKRFVTALSKKTPSAIKEMADNDKFTKKPSTRYAKVYVNEYNNSLSKSKRLKMSKLED